MNWVEQVMTAAVRLGGFSSKWTEVDGARIHFLELKGENPAGETLVIIHGITSSSVELARFARKLKPQFRRILLLDLPAHGLSATPQKGAGPQHLTELFIRSLDQILDGPAVVYGNSMGGLATIRFALAKPQKVKALILSSPGGASMPDEELKNFLAGFRMKDLGEATAFLKRLYAHAPWYIPAFSPFVRSRFNRAAILELLTKISQNELLRAEELRRLSQPILMIWGKKDRIHGSPQLEFFKKNLPSSARVVEPENFGHCPHLESPDQLAELVSKFDRELA